MKVLLVKTSSMGDIVHTLTAVREAKKQRPYIMIDWLVEESFADIADIARQSGDIRQIIPIRFRQWRKRKPFGIFFNPHIRQLKQKLNEHHYDIVLDAQGLLKSVFLARLAKTPIVGFDKYSAREPWATKFYQTTYHVEKEQHAIERQRQLFSQAFDYLLATDSPTPLPKQSSQPKTIILLHGTTWDNKRYPTLQWQQLAQQLCHLGYRVQLLQNSNQELKEAQQIAQGIAVNILPKQTISNLIPTLRSSTAVISVDTGLAHLATYFGIPTIMLFGPTRPELTGGIGEHTINIVGKAKDTASMKRESYADNQTFSASMSAISPTEILSALQSLCTS